MTIRIEHGKGSHNKCHKVTLHDRSHDECGKIVHRPYSSCINENSIEFFLLTQTWRVIKSSRLFRIRKWISREVSFIKDNLGRVKYNISLCVTNKSIANILIPNKYHHFRAQCKFICTNFIREIYILSQMVTYYLWWVLWYFKEFKNAKLDKWQKMLLSLRSNPQTISL